MTDKMGDSAATKAGDSQGADNSPQPLVVEVSADGGDAVSQEKSGAEGLFEPVHVQLHIWVPRDGQAVVQVKVDGRVARLSSTCATLEGSDGGDFMP
jgi:hypothetical protein